MIQPRPKPTFLRRLHPITKLWMSLGLTLAIILFANTWFSLLLMLVGVLLPWLGWKFYEEGLMYALAVFRRIAPLMAVLFLLFRTINMTDLGVGLTQAGLSYRAAFIFVTTFQLLPVLSKDMQQVMDAQRSRGLDTEGNLWQRFKAFVPIMVPVIANSIAKIQEQAIALETKGFNLPGKKTVYRDLPKTAADRLLTVGSILLALCAIVYRIVAAFA